MKLFDRVYYKDGKNLTYLGKIALLDACGYTLLCGYNNGLKLEDYPNDETVIKQLKKNNTYYKDEKYYFVNIEDNIFVIKHGATFIKNE